MKRKMVGILVATLLIITAVLPAVGVSNASNINENKSDLIEIKSTVTILDDLGVIIDSSDPSKIIYINDIFEIYEGLHWQLTVNVYWDPPQPERPICLWVDTETLPAGATFPECTCSYGEVAGVLDWTPSIGQAGTYNIFFYAGENCYEPIGYFVVTVIVYPYNLEPQDTFEIYEGQHWQLTVNAYWVPSQPERLICLWLDPYTLPYGATFSPCHCDYGQVCGLLDWTPSVGQAGTYLITFLAGGTCGEYIFPFIIEIIVYALLCDKEPKLTDDSGNTKFYGVFVGCNHAGTNSELLGSENDALAMHDALEGKTGWEEQNMRALTGASATKKNIKDTIDKFKDGKDNPPDPKPGDEFLFYFSDHGGQKNDANGDEADGKDETIVAADGAITDDELAEWLSDFPKCVTINVKLDSCHSGGFKDGNKDVQHAKNANNQEYGKNKIAIETACPADKTTSERSYEWNDNNHDGIASPDELGKPLGMTWIDKPPKNGKWDPGESRWHWNDKDGDGEIDPGEEYEWGDKNNVASMGDFTKKNLEGLAKKGACFGNVDYTNADRNMDGKTTTKELYEYSINALYEEFFGDNDNDGLIDEDGYEFEEVEGVATRLYVDNDGDGVIDEDPAPPPGSAFWPNEEPDKPATPDGTDSGKAGETYTYTTSTSDPDSDDVYYWFEWGDGTNSGWVGPSTSGDPVSMSHSWSAQGDYTIRVKARDRCFAESDWATLSISMPKSKQYANSLILNFLRNYPNLFQILQRLLNL